jgi:putative ABC transport system permease protein
MILRLWRRIAYLWRQRQMDADLAEELELHREMKQVELERSGLSPHEASYASRRTLGNLTLSREDARAVWVCRWLDDFGRDLAYGFRGLRRDPGFSVVVVFTLALGIGATTAIFSVLNAVLLQPLPYANPERLVRIFRNVPIVSGSGDTTVRRVAALDSSKLDAFRSQTQTLSHVGMFSIRTTMWRAGRDETSRLHGLRLSPAIFPMLGVQPIIGRTFEAREEVPGEGSVAVLSYGAWQRHFGGDLSVLGRNVLVESVVAFAGDGRTYSIIGVMPKGFYFPDPQTEFWIPLPTDPKPGRAFLWIARVRDGISIQAAQAEVSRILQQLLDDAGATAQLPPFELARVKDAMVAPVRRALIILASAVGFLLLIACGNVANLLLARAAIRRREIEIRVAIGAGRSRLLRQLLTESALLAFTGGVAGVGLAFGGIHLLRSLAQGLSRPDLTPGVIPRLEGIGLDAPALTLTLAVSALTGLVFGVGPAIHQSRSSSVDTLRKGAGSSMSGFNLFRRDRAQGLLVVAEIGMAMILFVGGGLLLHSLWKLVNVHPGYDSRHVLTFQLSMPKERLADGHSTKVGELLTARLQSFSSVRAVGYAESLPIIPLFRSSLVRTTLAVPPSSPAPGTSPEQPDTRIVSHGFLAAMGTKVVAGRGFDDADAAGMPQVMLINQTMARSGLFGANPLGQHVYIDFGDHGTETWEVVGIVEDVRQEGLDQDSYPQIYVDFRQYPGSPSRFGPYFAVRTDGTDASVASNIRAIVKQIDPQATVDSLATMEQLVSNSLARRRLYAVLLTTLAAVAVVLAAVGLYGLIAYAVAQRTHEIGVRMALGAQRADVVGLVLRQSAVVTILGISLGIAGAAAVTRYLEGMLFGLTPLDLPTFVTVAAVFAAVAMVATFVPARRATKVDPMVALRCE